jgi:hypothetical protein
MAILAGGSVLLGIGPVAWLINGDLQAGAVVARSKRQAHSSQHAWHTTVALAFAACTAAPALPWFTGLNVVQVNLRTPWLRPPSSAAGLGAVIAAVIGAGFIISIPGPCMRATMLNVNDPGGQRRHPASSQLPAQSSPTTRGCTLLMTALATQPAAVLTCADP